MLVMFFHACVRALTSTLNCVPVVRAPHYRRSVSYGHSKLVEAAGWTTSNEHRHDHFIRHLFRPPTENKNSILLFILFYYFFLTKNTKNEKSSLKYKQNLKRERKKTNENYIKWFFITIAMWLHDVLFYQI